MKLSQALRSGARLCHSHFSLLWIETAWRAGTFLLCLGFSLLGIFVLLDRTIAVSTLEILEDAGPVGILRVLTRVLLKDDNLIWQITLLVLAFSVVVWLLLASFFQGGILASLAGKTAAAGLARQNGWEWTYNFLRSGMRFFPSFLVINLLSLFFSFTGALSFVLILSFFLRSIFSTAGVRSSMWFLWPYPLAIALVSLIVATSQQFLEMSRIFLTRYQCSRWSAWNRAAEFFFLNLGPMSGVSSFIRMLQFIFAVVAAIFVWQLGFVLGSRFLGLFLSVLLFVCLGYGVLRNYLRLLRSGSLLALIDQ
jgi:hypothetical protein